jgi:hypothetical protein
MAPPGYYKTDVRATTISEMVRFRGWLMLPFTFILTRFFMRPRGGVWMPGLCAEMECRVDELSALFWEATQSERSAFDQLGFAPCVYTRLKRNLNPMYLDEGGIAYLHSDRSYVGTLVYGRIQVPSPSNRIRVSIVVGFTAAFETGSLSFTNSKNRFDPLPGRDSVRVKSSEPAVIYERFLSRLRIQPRTPRIFADCNEVRAWLDECRLEAFEARVARGLYVRMSDAEVAQARRRMGGFMD